MSFHVPEKYRIITGPMASKPSFGNNGLFIIKSLKLKQPLRVIASDGLEWNHVSVSLPNRVPSWDEMCFIKEMFFDDEDCVMQLHPPASEYVNNHPYTLHLWQPHSLSIPMPMMIMV